MVARTPTRGRHRPSRPRKALRRNGLSGADTASRAVHRPPRMRVRGRNRPRSTPSGMAGLVVDPLVQPRYPADPAAALRVFEGHDVVQAPVEVIRDEGHLFVQLVEGVAYEPP